MIFPKLDLKSYGNNALMIRLLQHIKVEIAEASPYICDAMHENSLDVEEFKDPSTFLLDEIGIAIGFEFSVVEWRMKCDKDFAIAVMVGYEAQAESRTVSSYVNRTQLALEYRQQWLDHMIESLK